MKIYAHRGFSFKYPEASRTAYQEAIHAGADGLECDVRLTSDGIAICFHDRDTKRISGVKKVISKTTFSQLKKLVDPMTLDELFELAAKSGRDLIVETKHPVRTGGRVEREVLRRVKSQSGTQRIILISFSIFATLRLLRHHTDVGFVISKTWRAIFIPTQVVAIDIELFRRSSWARRRVRTKEVLLWTVNDPADIKLLRDWKISGVITDRPDLDFRS